MLDSVIEDLQKPFGGSSDMKFFVLAALEVQWQGTRCGDRTILLWSTLLRACAGDVVWCGCVGGEVPEYWWVCVLSCQSNNES